MALDFPNAPTDGQIYTDTGSGEQWVYEAATNSWTSKGLVNTAGGLQYKGDIDITAVPPTGATSGSQYSVNPGGTANAGFGPGVTGTVTKGSMVMYTGTGWIETSHAVPDATPLVKGIDIRKWNRTGTVLSPATTGDVVNISAGTAALPGLTPVGDPNTGIYSPGADQLAVVTGGTQRIIIAADTYVRLAAGTGGIQFGGDTAAANALDDYEEGTWTPDLQFGGAKVGMTYTTQSGTYTKIGKLVYVIGLIALSNKGSSTGNATVAGLPFNAPVTGGAGNGGGGLSYWSGFVTAKPEAFATGGATISVYTGATSFASMADANFANGTYMFFYCTYQIS